jgi:hypothetical protein
LELQNLQASTNVLQKRYFLIISAENLEKALRGYGNVVNELMDAGLHLKTCSKESVEICLKKLIPTYGNDNSIKFTTKGYEILNTTTKTKTYYRTVMVSVLPKMVGSFWNQELFNMDNVTVNIQCLNITEKQKNRYADKLAQLTAERKARTMTDRAAKNAEIEAIIDLANAVGAGGAKIKRIKYFITYSANSIVELKKLERKILNCVHKTKMKVSLC